MRPVTGAVVGLALLAGCSSFASPWSSDETRSEVGDAADFPDELDGWSLQSAWSVLPRAFEGDQWTPVPGQDYDVFPATMNGCDSQRFLVRWRVVTEGREVEAALLDAVGDPSLVVTGSSGAISFDGCSTPAFRLPGDDLDEYSTLTDVTAEVQQFSAAP